MILGATGMIGSTITRILSRDCRYNVIPFGRRKIDDSSFSRSKLLLSPDLTCEINVSNLIREYKPEVVINCAGLTKHLPECLDPIKAISINTLFPHYLAKYCLINDCRLIHISTDCVFNGELGDYTEESATDAVDLYGKSKSLGEVINNHHLTIRTSTIGHEIGTSFGLLEWFLNQKTCSGYSNAYFSGIPSTELAFILRDIVLQDDTLIGLMHVGGYKIDKYTLLKLIAAKYKKKIHITQDETLKINRSFLSTKFELLTNYRIKSWHDLIDEMFNERLLD
jgi:dTDP-4-dehydrorhamnose reductase